MEYGNVGKLQAQVKWADLLNGGGGASVVLENCHLVFRIRHEYESGHPGEAARRQKNKMVRV